MRRAMLAAFLLIATAGLYSQVNGTPPSVLSLGPGRSFAPPPSITSLGPNGWTNAPVLLGSPNRFSPRLGRGHGGHRRGGRGGLGGPIFVPYAVPFDSSYYGDYFAAPEPDPQTAPAGTTDYRAIAPRVFAPQVAPDDQGRYGTHYLDGRGPIADSSIGQHPYSANNGALNDRPSGASESQPKTVLIFKDGHRLEVTNYAIQGSTLFNLSGEGPRRISIADIDVDATRNANDDLGINFSLP